MDELNAVEAWASGLLARLSPAGRHAATLGIARELRRSQQARIAEQKNPDGTVYEPRKMRSGGRRPRDKHGRIKRAAMFARLRNSRWMLIEGNGQELAIGFTGRVARLARVHHFGEKSPISPGALRYRYAARVLLGLTDAEREMVRDRLLRDVRV